jgi:hypothetical protein
VPTREPRWYRSGNDFPHPPCTAGHAELAQPQISMKALLTLTGLPCVSSRDICPIRTAYIKRICEDRDEKVIAQSAG